MEDLDAAGKQSAGLHHLMAGIVDCRGGVIDGTDQREFIRMFGHLGEDFADLIPGAFVLIGLKGPRTSAGAFGFISHVSS